MHLRHLINVVLVLTLAFQSFAVAAVHECADMNIADMTESHAGMAMTDHSGHDMSGESEMPSNANQMDCCADCECSAMGCASGSVLNASLSGFDYSPGAAVLFSREANWVSCSSELKLRPPIYS